jgi:twitching motility protein PilI
MNEITVDLNSTSPSPQSSTSTGTSTRWLSPVEALGRFAPKERLQLEAEGEKEQIARFGFRVGELGMLIGHNIGSEVVPPSAIARIPNTPAWLTGVTNLRGNLVPVFDLALLFESEAEAGETSGAKRTKKMILVMGKGDRAAGLLIDGYPRSVKSAVPLTELPPLPEALAPHVAAAFLHEGAAWIEFRHEEFFDSLSRRMAA